MTNNSDVLAYNIAGNNVSSNEERWYNNALPFWLITLVVSAGIIAATELWVLPLVIRYEFDLSWIKAEMLYMFANMLVDFTKEAAPYSIPVISAILWFRFNFTLRKLSYYGLLEYMTSIGAALMGIVFAVLITAFAFIVISLIVLVLGLYLGIKLTKWSLILT